MQCFAKAPGALRGTKSLLMTRFQSIRSGRPATLQPTGSQLLHAAAQHATRRQQRQVLSRAASSTDAETFSTSTSSGSPRICILGGGFGGLYTAIKLESLIWPKGKKPQVTLIDQSERFVFKPLLYEVLNETASESEVAPLFDQLLAPYPISFLQDKVSEVQPQQEGAGSGGAVVLASGERVEYDWLVVALGAEVDARGVPGVKEHAVPFSSYEDALKIKAKLDELASSSSSRGTVVIVGAGYSGVELASVVAERVKGGADVVVITPGADIMEAAPAGQRQAAAKALAADGVQIMTGCRVNSLSGASSEGAPERCTLSLSTAAAGGGSSSSSQLEADLVVWTAGFSPVTKARPGFPFPTSSRGSLETEATLQVKASPNTFALGDVSMSEVYDSSAGAAFPATAQVAFQQADYVAWNLWAAINGRPQLPFRYQHLGDMMSLGQLNAAVALPISLPPVLQQSLQSSPLGGVLQLAGVQLGEKVTLEGPLAAALRRAAYLYRQPTNEQRVSVAASWVAQAAEVGPKILQQVLGSGAGQQGQPEQERS